MKLVINADDCGISEVVDTHIEKAITVGSITSTTVMVNMQDLEGAASLYKKYKDIISFGWHLNLTEGSPLTYSQLLLDKGFFVEKDSVLLLNGKPFKNKLLTKSMRDDIVKELNAQYSALRDNGIVPSHLDGHHHIHTSLWAMMVLPSFLNEKEITRIRRLYNNVPGMISRLVRNGWASYFKSNGFRMTELLCSYSDYAHNQIIENGKVIELECHPGHPKYKEEEDLLLNAEFRKEKGIELINYHNI